MRRTTDRTPSLPRLPRMLRVNEVADVLGVSTDTVRRRIADGQLVAMRSGRVVRVSDDALRSFISRSRTWK